jgi:hypothetical protein
MPGGSICDSRDASCGFEEIFAAIGFRCVVVVEIWGEPIIDTEPECLPAEFPCVVGFTVVCVDELVRVGGLPAMVGLPCPVGAAPWGVAYVGVAAKQAESRNPTMVHVERMNRPPGPGLSKARTF